MLPLLAQERLPENRGCRKRPRLCQLSRGSTYLALSSILTNPGKQIAVDWRGAYSQPKRRQVWVVSKGRVTGNTACEYKLKTRQLFVTHELFRSSLSPDLT